MTALVVVTVLAAINHGPVLPTRLAWQRPLTDALPFDVATCGALSNSRRVPPRSVG